MKQKFSTKWKASKQPRKQRKFIANAPLHLKRKMLSSNLSKPLREKHKIRNIELRKGDKVRIMRGKFKKKQGKVIEVKTKLLKVYVEGIQVKKTDGSKVNVALRASNLQIIELNLEDKKRIRKMAPKGVPSVKEDINTEGKKQTPKNIDSTTKIMEKKK